MSENESKLTFNDPIVKRNYHIMNNYIIFLLDSGLSYLKREFLTRFKKEDYIKKFSAESFFDFILRENLRNKIKGQVHAVLSAAKLYVEQFDGNEGSSEEINKIIEKRYPMYEHNDMTLLHTSETHPGHQELKIISKLTFRVVVLQSAHLMACREENITDYSQLIRAYLSNN